MHYCHRCKEIMFDWEGKRAEQLPNTQHHVYYHVGCFQQVKKERGDLGLRLRKTDINPIERSVSPVSE